MGFCCWGGSDQDIRLGSNLGDVDSSVGDLPPSIFFSTSSLSFTSLRPCHRDQFSSSWCRPSGRLGLGEAGLDQTKGVVTDGLHEYFVAADKPPRRCRVEPAPYAASTCRSRVRKGRVQRQSFPAIGEVRQVWRGDSRDVWNQHFAPIMGWKIEGAPPQCRAALTLPASSNATNATNSTAAAMAGMRFFRLRSTVIVANR